VPIVLVDEQYWRSVINFEQLVAAGMIDAADLTLFRYAEDAESVWQHLVAMGLQIPRTT
jgi:predicted Rossmann-fold nucleotide-binding protein